MRPPRIREIVADANGYARVAESGDWIEVIDGGRGGFRNLIALRSRDEDPGLAGADQVPCVSGMVNAAEFDEIVLAAIVPSDTVVVRVGEGPPPPMIVGKDRIRWLSQGSSTLAAGTGQYLVDLRSYGVNVYEELERSELLSWTGWIWCRKQISVWTSMMVNPATPTTELAIQNFAVRLLGALPTGITGVSNVYVCTLDGTTNAAGDPRGAPFLGNTVGLQVANIDAANGSLAWMVGLRG